MGKQIGRKMKTAIREGLYLTAISLMLAYSLGYFNWPDGVATFYIALQSIILYLYILGALILSSITNSKDNHNIEDVKAKIRESATAEWYVNLKIAIIAVILINLNAPILAALFLVVGLIVVRQMYNLIKD